MARKTRDLLFTLPFELRLQIYSYLLGPSLHLDFCESLTQSRIANISDKRRPSPILSYLQKRRLECQWARDHGFHLIATSPKLHDEILTLIDCTDASLITHCPACLDRLLCHLVRDLGLKFPVIKTVWFRIKGSGDNFGILPSSTLAKTIDELRVVLVRNYGAYHEFSSYNDDFHCLQERQTRVWIVEHKRWIGRLTGRSVRNHHDSELLPDADTEIQNAETDDLEEDDNADDMNETWDLADEEYCHPRRTVKELEKQTTRVTLTENMNLELREKKKARKLVDGLRLAPEEGMWRRSFRLENEWEGWGRRTKGLRLRDEVWVGAQLRV